MEYLQSEALSALPRIAHGFFTRNGGVSEGLFASLNCAHGTGDDAAKVDENFLRIGQALGVAPGHVLKAWQVHGTECATATTPWRVEDRPKVDAIVTNVPGLAIGITTADCGPLLFADAEARVIGAAHAGWKGAFAGIIESTVLAMERLGAKRERMTVTLGPCIQQESYEVGSEFVEKFLSEQVDYKTYFIPSPRERHALFNLPAFILDRLKKAGVIHANLLARDTCLEENTFFSYRRATLRGEKAYGCQLSAIALQ